MPDWKITQYESLDGRFQIDHDRNGWSAWDFETDTESDVAHVGDFQRLDQAQDACAAWAESHPLPPDAPIYVGALQDDVIAESLTAEQRAEFNVRR